MPTVLELAGAPVPERIDGRSGAKYLMDGREPEEDPVCARLLLFVRVLNPQVGGPVAFDGTEPFLDLQRFVRLRTLLMSG